MKFKKIILLIVIMLSITQAVIINAQETKAVKTKAETTDNYLKSKVIDKWNIYNNGATKVVQTTVKGKEVVKIIDEGVNGLVDIHYSFKAGSIPGFIPQDAEYVIRFDTCIHSTTNIEGRLGFIKETGTLGVGAYITSPKEGYLQWRYGGAMVEVGKSDAYILPKDTWVRFTIHRLPDSKYHVYVNDGEKRDLGIHTVDTEIGEIIKINAGTGMLNLNDTGSFSLRNYYVPSPPKKTAAEVLTFNVDDVKKDLKDSIQGVDAESFAIGRSTWGINLRTLLNEQRSEFKAFLKKVGRPTMRMMDFSRYSWRGPEVTDALEVKGSKEWWWSPKELHEFCRENDIKLIGFFDTKKLYDVKTGKVTSLLDHKTKTLNMTPEQMDALVEENLYKLRWVKKNGYLDLYSAWEIGNEVYIAGVNSPEVYATFAKKMTKAAKKVDPKIRVAVTIFVCAADDANLFSQSGKNPRDMSGKEEQDVYDKWLAWSNTVMKLLGDVGKDIYYINLHLYGPSLRYNANAKGIDTHVRVVQKHPNMQHARFIVTEWRHTGSSELHGQREFKTSALWAAKFSMVLLAHPLMDSTGIHDFFTYSGTGYWSDGKIWRAQWKSLSPRKAYPSKTGKRELQVGPFGPVLKMLNNIARNYPLLLEHKANLGKYSSADFFDNCSPKTVTEDEGRDLQWIIACNRKKNKFGGMVVNTHVYPVRITLQSKGKKYNITKATSENCPADKLFELEIPGDAKFWKLEALKVNSDGSIDLPPLSITSFEMD
jgi:hypothetical protein